MLPDHLQRWPSTSARKALAARFGLPHDPIMQDWEWEVADASRFNEFLAAYDDPRLTDDERFSLMEMLIQSVADMELADVEISVLWMAVSTRLRANPALHASTMEYWAGLSEPGQFPEVASAIEQVWSEVREVLGA
jgi:hypothetical protein